VIPPAPNGFDGRSVCGNPSRLRPLPVHDRAIGRQMIAGAGPPANERNGSRPRRRNHPRKGDADPRPLGTESESHLEL